MLVYRLHLLKNFSLYSSNLLLFFFLFYSLSFKAQIGGLTCFGDVHTPTLGCSSLQIVDFKISESQQDFVFDTFSKWKSGITINGTTVIRVIAVQDATGGATTCDWKLRMRINNGSAIGNEWETLDTYGSATSGNKPFVGMLKVKVSNGCGTPQNNEVWQTFATDMAILDIINPSPSPVTTNLGNANCSGNETNGPGSYLSVDYNEFVFTIDYRIIPAVNVDLIPGRYQLKLDFCISQN
jgi:hypothetical protein